MGNQFLRGGVAVKQCWYLDNQDWVANVQSGAYREWIEHNYQDRKGDAKQ